MSRMKVFIIFMLIFGQAFVFESFASNISKNKISNDKSKGKTQDSKLQNLDNKINASDKILVEYIKKPFYFRFPPKLKDIKGKRVIMAKINYNHPSLGACTYQVVKDLDTSKFYGWCNTKKISRMKTQIFDLPEKFKNLQLSKSRVELGLNENFRLIINKINDLHKQVLNK